MINKSRYTTLIKERAQQLGFSWCGIARAEKLDEDARRLEQWLHKGYHGKMQYMENYFDLRIDPTKLVPGAKSVIVFLLNYFPKEQQDPNSPHISKYAYGRDYHEVIREKLNTLAAELKDAAGEIHTRGFVDSAPVLERSWAHRSGLGWIGKNGNFITRQQGSFFFIATLITDLELEYDDPFAKDYCGTCRKCIDACPTDAILDNKVIDGSKCVSYFTIELRDLLLPEDMKGKFEEWMFGCDICQDVCPWNRFSKPTSEPDFQPLPGILHFTKQEWEEISEDTFKTLFRHSPLKRTKLAGLQRNLRFLRNIE